MSENITRFTEVDLRSGAEVNGEEAGAVTAELATTLPAVTLLIALIISLAAALGTQFRVSDAARAGARAFAIGKTEAEIAQVVTQVAGLGASVELGREDGWGTVKVRHPVQIGPLALGPFSVTASATAWLEP
jgi:hypothetical protein